MYEHKIFMNKLHVRIIYAISSSLLAKFYNLSYKNVNQ